MVPGRSGCEEGSLITGSVSALVSAVAVAVTTVETAGEFSFTSGASKMAEAVPSYPSTAVDGGKRRSDSGNGAV
jgi:hypothetical protein